MYAFLVGSVGDRVLRLRQRGVPRDAKTASWEERDLAAQCFTEKYHTAAQGEAMAMLLLVFGQTRN